MRLVRLTLLACIAAVAFPAGAFAVRCAPPGNSGIDQYFETIPGASCNQASSRTNVSSESGPERFASSSSTAMCSAL